MTSTRTFRFLPILAFSMLALPAAVAAQTGTLFVEGGSVGVGVETPLKTLHVKGTADDMGLRVENTSGTTDGRILMELRNNGGINFLMVDSAGDDWQFIGQTTGGFPGFSISRQGSGVREFRVDPNGNLFLSGTVNASSSRSVKEDFAEVDTTELMQKLSQLPIQSWQYVEDGTGARHIGPVAEDFHAVFGVGSDPRHISTTDVSGIALAAAQELYRQNQAKDAEIADLQERLAALEALVSQLAAD